VKRRSSRVTGPGPGGRIQGRSRGASGGDAKEIKIDPIRKTNFCHHPSIHPFMSPTCRPETTSIASIYVLILLLACKSGMPRSGSDENVLRRQTALGVT